MNIKLIKSALQWLAGILISSSQLLATLVKDCLHAILGKVQWVVVLERFLTRLVVTLLKWLKSLSSNQLVDQTIEDILNGLREQGLREAKL